MGWNVAYPVKDSPLLANVGLEPRYYFVHSFCVEVEDKDHAIMTTDYGWQFDSAIAKENIYGVQFHPEKSHRFGMQILRNCKIIINMLRTRIIPALLLRDECLVKTTKFGKFTYVGDPRIQFVYLTN